MTIFWRQTGLVASGAVVGALFRELVFYLSEQAAPISPGGILDWPWALLFVNVSGAFILGGLIEIGSTSANWQRTVRPLFAVGVLGGYTTTSAFAVVTVEMLRNADFISAGLYVIASIAMAVWAFGAAQSIARVRMAKR